MAQVGALLGHLGGRTLARGRKAAALLLDRWHGTETVRMVSLAELGIDPTDHVHYAPSSWSILPRIAGIVPFTSADTFVDFGSGKGRVVLMAASKYPFKRVVGVEIAPELTAIAQDNLARNFRHLKCRNVDLVTADAVEFEIPKDMTIAYFYSPFFGDVFRRVIDNMEAAIKAGTLRHLWIVLVRPTVSSSAQHYAANDDYLQSRPWLRSAGSLEARTLCASIYRFDGAPL